MENMERYSQAVKTAMEKKMAGKCVRCNKFHGAWKGELPKVGDVLDRHKIRPWEAGSPEVVKVEKNVHKDDPHWPGEYIVWTKITNQIIDKPTKEPLDCLKPVGSLTSSKKSKKPVPGFDIIQQVFKHPVPVKVKAKKKKSLFTPIIQGLSVKD